MEDSATLSELGILPGSYLWVMDTGLHENRDIAGSYFFDFVDFCWLCRFVISRSHGLY